MLLHEVDKSFKRLKGCYKRAEVLAREGFIDPEHPLATAWGNCKFFLPMSENKTVEDYTWILQVLDWFALKVEDFLKSNLAADDESLKAILHEWQQAMFFNPCFLKSTN